MSRRARRYESGPKLNIKKVIAVLVFILVVIMFIIGIKSLLNSKNIDYKKIDITKNEDEYRKKLGEYYDIQGKVTVPQIIIGGKRIGGFDVLDKLNNAGELDKLLED